ncbi:hypothetical protein C0995_013367 [Termitomyces sp. Mi166|nr:hypothetical protein C0995_013367 [Termitomyces sp. Mi166\
MSTSSSNNELKEMLNEVGQALFSLADGKYEVMRHDAEPEAIWTMLAEMTDGIIGIYKRLATMSDRVSPNMLLEGISKDVPDGAAQAKDIIRGAQRSSRVVRNDIFDEKRRNLPSPRKNVDPVRTWNYP